MKPENEIVGYKALGAYTGHNAEYWRNLFGISAAPFGKYRIPYGHGVYFNKDEVDAHLKLNRPDWEGHPLGMEQAAMITRLEDVVGITTELADDLGVGMRLLRGVPVRDAKYIRDLLDQALSNLVALANLAGVGVYVAECLEGRYRSKYWNALKDKSFDAALEYLASEFADRKICVQDMAGRFDMCNSKGEGMDDVAEAQMRGTRKPYTK